MKASLETACSPRLTVQHLTGPLEEMTHVPSTRYDQKAMEALLNETKGTRQNEAPIQALTEGEMSISEIQTQLTKGEMCFNRCPVIHDLSRKPAVC